MEQRLFEAARLGNLQALYDAHGNDNSFLQKLHSWGRPETPLHLATMFGQPEFVREYMRLSSISARQLSQLNQDGYSPLHLASANGHLEIVQSLLEFGEQNSFVEELCMKADIEGRTALHCAVVSGKINVIDVLLDHCPQAARKETVQKETILHLAVKHHQQESLKFLIDHKLGSLVESLLNLEDREGNTILHLATAIRQLETVEYLVKQPHLNVNAENSYGLRALDIMFSYGFNSKDVYIEEAIRLAGGCRSQLATTTNETRLSLDIQDTSLQPSSDTPTNQTSLSHDTSHTSSKSSSDTDEWSKELKSGIIVMASVFATLTFQVALTPPGGVWQDWGSNATPFNSSVVPTQQPGVPILYDLDRKQFTLVMMYNTFTFMNSIATIVMMIQPFKLETPILRGFSHGVVVPYLVVFNVILIAVEFLSIEAIMTKKSVNSSRVWRTHFFWFLIILLALSSFFIKTGQYLLKMLLNTFPCLQAYINSQSSSSTTLSENGSA